MRQLGGGVANAAARARPGAAARPPGERTLLDDVAVKRPWNIVVKAARAQALLRQRLRPLADGVTVVIVSWNTKEVLADVLRAVERHSPPGTSVLVVDNDSSDGSRELLTADAGIRSLRMPANVGHGVALDLAMAFVRTRVAVTLDSDAIPLGPGWLDPAVEPVRSGGCVLAGLRSRRGFVHPVYLAVDVHQFLVRRLSFQVHAGAGVAVSARRWGENAWDTGELLTQQIDPDEVSFVEPTDNRAPGLPGMTVGGVVYHHGGMSRATDGGLTPDAVAGWRFACRALGDPAASGHR